MSKGMRVVRNAYREQNRLDCGGFEVWFTSHVDDSGVVSLMLPGDEVVCRIYASAAGEFRRAWVLSK